MTTEPPEEAITLTVAAPMPREPPVTKTTFSEKSTQPHSLDICGLKAAIPGMLSHRLRLAKTPRPGAAHRTIASRPVDGVGLPGLAVFTGFGAAPGNGATS